MKDGRSVRVADVDHCHGCGRGRVVVRIERCRAVFGTGNTAGDTSVAVNIGKLAAGGSVTITYQVTVNGPIAAGTTQISNQGVVTDSTLASNISATSRAAANLPPRYPAAAAKKPVN